MLLPQRRKRLRRQKPQRRMQHRLNGHVLRPEPDKSLRRARHARTCSQTRTTTGATVLITAYWRYLCTSSEWPEENCLNVCSDGDNAGTTAQITPCDGTDNSTEWCCGQNTDCCGTNSAVTIAPVLPALFSTAISSSTSTLPSTATGATPSNPTPDPASASAHGSSPDAETNSSTGLSTGAKAGIGIAVAVGAVAMIGGLVFVWVVKRRSSPPGYAPPDEFSKTPVVKVDPYAPDPAYMPDLNGNHIQELSAGQGLRHEMPVREEDPWR
ncbi:hypothetical protein BJY04DRAFT_223822 [Aspergillus karnatakaensis]|uniref:uncharacterized protein n=1 Tax=Aspergillus karnatakaensis TaxID=1810916 RepID=UPI003CCD104D